MRAALCLAALLAAAPAWAQERTGYKVFFQSEQPYLGDAGREVLKVVAERAKGCALKGIDVVGHTDTAEKDPEGLSLTRVLHVRTELTKRGIPQESIRIEMRGDKELAVKTADDVREPENRRAEVTVVCGAPAQVAPTASGPVKSLADIMFRPLPGDPPKTFTVSFAAEGGFTQMGQQQVDMHVGYAQACKFEKIEVLGRADPKEKSANLIAYSRALQVRTALVKAGLPEAKIMALGSVAPQPATDLASNRRAEVTITCAKSF